MICPGPMDSGDFRPTRPAHECHNVPSLSLSDAIALYSGLMTVNDVLSGLVSQPRFKGPGREPLSAAGDELDSMAEAIGFRMGELADLIRTGRPHNDLERQKRAAFLAICAIENDGDEADRIIAPFMTSPA